MSRAGEARKRWIAIVGQGRGGTSTLYYAVVDALHEAGHRTLRTYEKYQPSVFDSFARHHRDRWVVAKFLTNHPMFSEELLGRFGRRIQIVRDPRDSLVSVMLFSGAHLAQRKNGGRRVRRFVRLLEAKERDPSSVSLTTLLEAALAEGLRRDMTDFLERRYQYPIALNERTGMAAIRLEDLVAGRADTAEDIVGAPLRLRPPPTVKAHVLRSGKPSWSRWFLAEDVVRLRPVLQPFMDRFGYGDDWTLDPDAQIDPAESSVYVRRTFDSVVERAAQSRNDPPLELLRYRGGDGCYGAAYRAAVRLVESGDDLAAARELGLFAATAGHWKAMKLAATLFSHGIGGPVDKPEAWYWRRAFVRALPRIGVGYCRRALLEIVERGDLALEGVPYPDDTSGYASGTPITADAPV